MRRSDFILIVLMLCFLGGAPALALSQDYTAALTPIADNLTHPVMLAEPPDDSGRLFIVDQTGQIWIVTAEGKRLPQPFLNIENRLVDLRGSYDERGLLGLAFHPKFAENGRFFVFYSAPLREEAPDDFDHTNRVSEFRVTADRPHVADPGSEKILMEIDHPYSNHNSGVVAFGPEGYLYVSLGDGGHRNDMDTRSVQGHAKDWYEKNEGGNGQDIEKNLLGSILRIDVDRQEDGKAYAIPKDNPFTEVPGVLGEIYAYGFRNPYRFGFDTEYGLIAGDAGQNMFEEIDQVSAGGNYGWNVYEGRHCFNAASATEPFETCPEETGAEHPVPGKPLIGPVIEFKNSAHFGEEGLGLAVIGGHVYRGTTLPDAFQGKYLFGVWSRGHQHSAQGEKHLKGSIFVAFPQKDAPWPFEPLRITNGPEGNLPVYLLALSQDREGEIYVLGADSRGPSGESGRVFKLIPPDKNGK